MASVQESGMWVPETRSQKNGKESKIESWWEVKRSDNPADPRPTRGATPLVERCMRVHGFTEGFAKRVLKGYRQFMELKSVMNDWNETKLSPSVPINQMWEQHLLDNLNYTEDCLLLFGRVIGHNPDSILDGKSLQERVMTTKIAFQARYGDDLDQDVWDFGDDWGSDSLKHDTPLKAVGSPGEGALGGGRLPVASVATDDGPISGSRRGGQSRPMTTPTQRNMATNSTRAAPKSPPSAPAGGNEPITIFLRDSNTGEETYFSLRYKSTLRIVFTVFAERRGLNQDLLKFTYNGQTLKGYETPHSLSLDDRARIDVLIQRRA
eukprot:Nitzschia sp. Nitz4//scaffold39_size137210//61536//62501//NITZ4_003200-RA/size137210-processed-gene-0.115-mRNA-1//-1//CDS//3329550386//3906//frame0